MTKGVLKIVAFLTMAAAAWCLAACAQRKPMHPPAAVIEDLEGRFLPGRIIDLNGGRAIPFEDFIDVLGSHPIIFIGEVHDNAEHHLLQVQILQALVARHGPIPIAMEFFHRDQQSILDRYTQGTISESEFLTEVDWDHTWGFDYHLYRPLLLKAREESVRVLAINAPRHVVGKIARAGLDSLSVSERDQVAREIDLSNEAHRSMVREAYELDAHKDISKFEYFYQAQCTWEDTMAESIAEHMEKDIQRVVVLSGNGHIVYGFGIPDRTARRTSSRPVTVALYPLGGTATIPRDLADYVWLTRDCSHPSGFQHGHDPGKVR